MVKGIDLRYGVNYEVGLGIDDFHTKKFINQYELVEGEVVVLVDVEDGFSDEEYTNFFTMKTMDGNIIKFDARDEDVIGFLV